MASFRERLREMQTDLEAASCRRVPLDDEALGLCDEAERCRHLRGRLAEGVEALMEEFAREFEGFSVRRYFYEGELAIELVAREIQIDARERLCTTFSRVFLQIVVHRRTGRIEQRCKMAVGGRELPGDVLWSSVSGVEPLEQAARFAERQLLRFARTWLRRCANASAASAA